MKKSSYIIGCVLFLLVLVCFIIYWGQRSVVENQSMSTTNKVPEKLRNSLGMEFVYIPPGSFMMGSPSEEPGRDNDETLHKVILTKSFYMQTTEVTHGQWKAIMGNSTPYFKDCGDDCPLVKVDWNNVKNYLRRLNGKEGTDKYRLPTEAEWEYSCRAGTDMPFYFGNCLSTDEANYDGRFSLTGCSKGKHRKSPIPVGSLLPNAWGLYDMHGNVSEWCYDLYGKDPLSIVTDPRGPSTGSVRVIRGGSWRNSAMDCRSANRDIDAPGSSWEDDLGFRLARDP